MKDKDTTAAAEREESSAISAMEKKMKSLEGMTDAQLEEMVREVGNNLPLPKDRHPDRDWMVEFLARHEANMSYLSKGLRPPENILRGHLMFLSQEQKPRPKKLEAAAEDAPTETISELREQLVKPEEPATKPARAKQETAPAPREKKSAAEKHVEKKVWDLPVPPKHGTVDLSPESVSSKSPGKKLSKDHVEKISAVSVKHLLASLDREADGSSISTPKVKPELLFKKLKRGAEGYLGHIDDYRIFARPVSEAQRSSKPSKVDLLWNIVKMSGETGMMFWEAVVAYHLTYKVGLYDAYSEVYSVAYYYLEKAPGVCGHKKDKQEITGSESLIYVFQKHE